MNFTSYVHLVCGRDLGDLSPFELVGLSFAKMCGVPPESAFDFLGRFGDVNDIIRAAEVELASARASI